MLITRAALLATPEPKGVGTAMTDSKSTRTCKCGRRINKAHEGHIECSVCRRPASSRRFKKLPSIGIEIARAVLAASKNKSEAARSLRVARSTVTRWEQAYALNAPLKVPTEPKVFVKSCRVCSRKFQTKMSRTKLCSAACVSHFLSEKAKRQAAANGYGKVEVPCAHCGVLFQRGGSSVKRYRAHFCSRSCQFASGYYKQLGRRGLPPEVRALRDKLKREATQRTVDAKRALCEWKERVRGQCPVCGGPNRTDGMTCSWTCGIACRRRPRKHVLMECWLCLTVFEGTSQRRFCRPCSKRIFRSYQFLVGLPRRREDLTEHHKEVLRTAQLLRCMRQSFNQQQQREVAQWQSR